jgi:hypothetical protein
MPQGDIPTSIVDKSARHTLEWKLHWLFRLALIGAFVGLGTSWCAVIIAVPRFTWKHATEFLYVPAQIYSAWWEVMERDSGYAAPLLWIGFQRELSHTG